MTHNRIARNLFCRAQFDCAQCIWRMGLPRSYGITTPASVMLHDRVQSITAGFVGIGTGSKHIHLRRRISPAAPAEASTGQAPLIPQP